jgi:hypothetical protein
MLLFNTRYTSRLIWLMLIADRLTSYSRLDLGLTSAIVDCLRMTSPGVLAGLRLATADRLALANDRRAAAAARLSARAARRAARLIDAAESRVADESRVTARLARRAARVALARAADIALDLRVGVARVARGLGAARWLNSWYARGRLALIDVVAAGGYNRWGGGYRPVALC